MLLTRFIRPLSEEAPDAHYQCTNFTLEFDAYAWWRISDSTDIELMNFVNKLSLTGFQVNFLREIITLYKEVRNLKALGFRVPLAIVNKAHQANQLYPFAVSLIESVRTYERTLEKVSSPNAFWNFFGFAPFFKHISMWVQFSLSLLEWWTFRFKSATVKNISIC